MKKQFLLLCTVLLVLSCALPLLSYRAARAVLGQAAAPSPAPASGSQAAFPAPAAQSAAFADTDVVRFTDEGTGQLTELPLRDYLIGAAAAEMPVSWPDEALKAQIIAAHSYALYCRDHSPDAGQAWFSADPARRQGCLTDPVLHSYWGTAYEANYARLAALADSVLSQVLCYDGAPAAASYFAISNGCTEASENVWDSALPYLISVDSGTDLAADHYEYTAVFSAEQVRRQLAALGIATEGTDPAQWFGTPQQTAAGYVANLPVCGQTVAGTALRRALGLRSACFRITYQSSGSFAITTKGYGHGVGMSQWGAKAMAEQGAGYAAILAHYYPGTTLSEN